jgi:hypothetical protein
MAWNVSCTETDAERRRPSRQNYASARVELNVSPTMGLPLKMISLAFQDAVHCRAGLPTPEAREAYEWLQDDSFRPASFRWACHWLGLDPEKVRTNGLPSGNIVHQYRGGLGVREIVQSWEEARIRFSSGTSPSSAQRRPGGGKASHGAPMFSELCLS